MCNIEEFSSAFHREREGEFKERERGCGVVGVVGEIRRGI